jgi:hypothetical protein
LWTSSKAHKAANTTVESSQQAVGPDGQDLPQSITENASLGSDLCHENGSNQPPLVGFPLPIASQAVHNPVHNVQYAAFPGVTSNGVSWMSNTLPQHHMPMYPAVFSNAAQPQHVYVEGHAFGTGDTKVDIGTVDNEPVSDQPSKMSIWQHAAFVAILLFLISLLIAVACVAGLRHTYTKVYYVAAEEVTWDYGPSGINGVSGKPFTDPSEEQAAQYMVKTDKLLGRQLKKVRFIEYTDGSFTTKKDVAPKVSHEQMHCSRQKRLCVPIEDWAHVCTQMLSQHLGVSQRMLTPCLEICIRQGFSSQGATLPTIIAEEKYRQGV